MSKYIIEEKRLKELLKAEHKLSALEGGGVDNWSYYGDHYDSYFDGISNDIISKQQKEELHPNELIEILVFADMTKFDRLKEAEVNNIISASEENTQLDKEMTLPLAIEKYQEIERQFDEIQETVKKMIADQFYEETTTINVKEERCIRLNFVINGKLYFIICYITATDSTDMTPANIHFATDFEIENIGIDNRIKIQQIFTTKEKDSD